MKITPKHIFLAFATLLGFQTAQAQKVLQLPDNGSLPFITFAQDTLRLDYNPSIKQVSLMTNKPFTVGVPKTPWLTATSQGKDRLTITTQYNVSINPRSASIPFVLGDSTYYYTILQEGNTAATTIKGDTKWTIASAVANQSQSGEGIDKSYDGNNNTLYHSPWSGTNFPVVLTYTLKGAPHVDYILYTPRQDGQNNGYFKEIEVAYNTTNNNNFVALPLIDLKGSNASSHIDLTENGVDNVKQVRITVKSGTNNFASAAEVGFYSYDATLSQLFDKYFSDKLHTKLKEGITANEIAAIQQPFIKQLASAIAEGNYSTEFRVGEFEAYPDIETQARKYKTSTYNRYENPTGIYFTPGTPIVIFVDGIANDPVKLIIKNFGKNSPTDNQSESSYALKNGLNVITPSNRGNGYVSYYTDNASAPNVKMHFAMGNETGYFDLDKHTNKDWVRLLANAKSDIMDMKSLRIQAAYPVQRLLENCPTQGHELLTNMDSVIYYERDVMGMHYYKNEPKNRQFARVVWSGFMFKDGVGAAAHDNSISGWLKPSTSEFEYWGFAHEIGHTNQIGPDFHYAGTGETTNNIYSAWAQFRLSTANWWRLESEHSGQGEFYGLKGGRFEHYFDSSLRQGTPWQLVDGSDYHGSAYETHTVKIRNYDGTMSAKDTTVQARNMDHFVKLAPLWQLLLYCDQAGFAPEVYGKVFQTYRTTSFDDGTPSPGKYQMRFMKLVCDSTGLNFLPFFEKAGMLKPINAYILDYTPDWLRINQDMIDNLKAHVKAKGYPTPKGEINYITALNWKTYYDKAEMIPGTLNAGTQKVTDSRGMRIRIQHNVWKNVVAFETFDANDKLIRISMQGLGGPDNGNTYTEALFPHTAKDKAKYIMAVGWDGKRVKCYEE